MKKKNNTKFQHRKICLEINAFKPQEHVAGWMFIVPTFLRQNPNSQHTTVNWDILDVISADEVAMEQSKYP